MTPLQMPPEHNIDPQILEELLRKTFGIELLRPGQEEAIASVLNGYDTLAVMPTGAGKSLCYQLPALYLNGTTIVVSPLISLMKDQADKLDEVGIDAAQMNSLLTQQGEAEEIQSIEKEKREIIFTTPERLAHVDFISALRRNTIDLFVIDEAHCISQWGHNFRPAFLHIADAIRSLGNPTVLALTATATQGVIEDIIKQLDLPNMRVINKGVYRSNLNYSVIPVTNSSEKFTHLSHIINQKNGSGIIYAATVKVAEEVYKVLKEAEENVTIYHGRLSANERKANQEAFMSGKCRLMIATNAFGMGIDKVDIRFIVHYQIPASPEAYYQESGRAGRDGEKADCILLYETRDKAIHQFFLAYRYPTVAEITSVYNGLRKLKADHKPIAFSLLRTNISQVAVTKQQVALKLLKDAHIVTQDYHHHYKLLRNDVSEEELSELAKEYQKKSAHDQEMLKRMIFYAQSGFCRWKVLLEYFGEKPSWSCCGNCDNCRRPAVQTSNTKKAKLTNPTSPRKGGFRSGERVKVPKYGEGQVISAAADKVTITFPNSDIRTFLRSYVEPC